jgi:hypothetical protein
MAAALEGLACAAAADDAKACARLLGAARQIRETTGIHLTLIEGHDPHQAQAHARSVLRTNQFTVATSTGKHSSLDEMLLLVQAHERSNQACDHPLSEGLVCRNTQPSQQIGIGLHATLQHLQGPLWVCPLAACDDPCR